MAGAPQGAAGLHGHLRYLARLDGAVLWSAWTHIGQPFTLVTLDFHASAGAHTLLFQADGLAAQSDTGTAFFDNVRVQPAPPFAAPSNVPLYHVIELPLPAAIVPGPVTGGDVVALNDLGQAAGNAFAGTASQALRWNAGTNQILASLSGGQSSRARGMNAGGKVVGESGASAVIWQTTTAAALNTPAGDFCASAADVDDSGAIIGSSTNAGGTTHLITWPGFGGPAMIQGAEPATGAARRNNGDLVGDGPRETGSGERESLYFDGAEWRFLLVGQSITAAINESGTVCGSEIVTSGFAQTRAWKATTGSLTYLPHLGASTNSTAEDINNAGDVVGSSLGKAALWKGATAIDLNTRLAPGSGWVLQKASAVNNRGQIAGVGTRNGQPRVFLLSPGPLPVIAWGWSDPQRTHAHLSWNSISTTLTIKRTFPPVGDPENIWQAEIVPNVPSYHYGMWSSIALFNNEPYIAYEDATAYGLVKLAHKTGGQWSLETVDGDPALPNQALFAGGPISLKLDHLGRPNVAYYSSEGLRWAAFNGTAWTYNKVDASTQPIGISLVLDADDHAHIAFFDAGGGTQYGLYYVHWNGSGWDQNHFQVSATVWNDGYKGTSSALALDTNGIPIIAFSDPGTGQLRINKLNGSPDFSDARWTNTVVMGASYSAYPSLAIDSANRPHVVYQRAEPGTNTVLQHARLTGTNWLVTTADAGGPAHYDVGANSCLVLDPQQRPRLSYWDTTMNTIRYAHFDGTTWLAHLVDPGNHVGLFSTSLTLDSWGAPHLSYYEQHTLPGGIVRGSLRYATLAPPRMQLVSKHGSVLELVWPSEPAGFQINSTTNLTSGGWQPWSATESENAGVKRATFGGGDPGRLFILKR